MAGGFNPFQGIQVLSVMRSRRRLSRITVSIPFREFKCCRQNGDFRIPSMLLNVSIPFREFKCCRHIRIHNHFRQPVVSIPFREFKCCRGLRMIKSEDRRHQSFNPFQGIQVLSVGLGMLDETEVSTMFQSLSGNSSVVGQTCSVRLQNLICSFNPFQGIQVLSGTHNGRKRLRLFRFQSLSGNSSVVGGCVRCGVVSSGEFQSLSGNSSVVGRQEMDRYAEEMRFQSLSGNSSVVGNPAKPFPARPA